MSHKFTLKLTKEEHGRLAGAASALRGVPVYGDRAATMQAIAKMGLARELDRLEREHRGGRAFRKTDAILGRPRGAGNG